MNGRGVNDPTSGCDFWATGQNRLKITELEDADVLASYAYHSSFTRKPFERCAVFCIAAVRRKSESLSHHFLWPGDRRLMDGSNVVVRFAFVSVGLFFLLPRSLPPGRKGTDIRGACFQAAEGIKRSCTCGSGTLCSVLLFSGFGH